MNQTHLFEILSIIKSNCGDNVIFKNANYTLDGIEAVLVDPYDNQEYVLSIKPNERCDGTISVRFHSGLSQGPADQQGR